MSILEEFRDLLEYARKVAKEVNSVILETVSGKPEVLYDASLHLIKAGGKRLRPLVTVLSGRLFGLPEEIGIRAGASVEILHNYTLVHDDIMDRDEFRRGVPTVHKVWGEAMAILAGDLLFAKAFEPLLSLSGVVRDDLILRAVKELVNVSVELAEGQALDMELSRRRDVTLEEYLIMIRKKTGELIKTSALIGGILAGAPEEELRKLSNFALNAGISFQIRDDILGLIADEKELGKPVLSDIREGKMTVLTIHALNNLEPTERERLLNILGRSNAEITELREAAELIKKSGALEFAEELARKYLDVALSELSAIKERDSEAKYLLKKLALYITRRKK